MDENNDKMRYTLESEDEMAQPQPMQSPAQPETAEPEAAQTDIDRASIPDKKTRRKIFLLLAAVALVAALGGSALTAAIRAISQMNEAQQAQQAQTTLAEQDVPETEKGPEAAQPETPASAEAELPYRIVSAPLPEELFSNSGDKSLTPLCGRHPLQEQDERFRPEHAAFQLRNGHHPFGGRLYRDELPCGRGRGLRKGRAP